MIRLLVLRRIAPALAEISSIAIAVMPGLDRVGTLLGGALISSRAFVTPTAHAWPPLAAEETQTRRPPPRAQVRVLGLPSRLKLARAARPVVCDAASGTGSGCLSTYAGKRKIFRVRPVEELRAMVTSFRVSVALSVAADLGLSDRLAEGPRTVAELALAVSADEDTLRRLLHALATVGVYAERQDGSFSNTPLGEGLRSDVPGSMRPLARTLTDPAVWSAWGHLGHSVRTGENAFHALHGVDVWAHRRGHPEHNAIFNDNMTALSSLVAEAVATAYDFSDFSSVVDVGGGQGILLEAVLTRHGHLTGTVFDLANVVSDVPTAATPQRVPSRWAVVTGSFFERVPPADVYILKSILHDWPDDGCREILRTCHRSLNADGVVLVVETVLGRRGHEVDAAFSDLNMLVLPGGRERTELEYVDLFDSAGLHLSRIIDTGTRFSILEAFAHERA